MQQLAKHIVIRIIPLIVLIAVLIGTFKLADKLFRRNSRKKDEL